MSSYPTVGEIIDLYEKHDVTPTPCRAQPSISPDNLCAVGIVAKDQEMCRGDAPYRLFSKVYPGVKHPMSYALAFDRGFGEAMGHDYGVNDRSIPGYIMGRAIGEWWKSKQELDQMEGSPYVEDRPTALVSG